MLGRSWSRVVEHGVNGFPFQRPLGKCPILRVVITLRVMKIPTLRAAEREAYTGNRKFGYFNRRRSQNIFEYVEVFYNRVRRHSALNYLSPVNFELAT